MPPFQLDSRGEWTLGNWIEGPNPFGLARPSDWWLKQLFDYDPALVLVPSQKDHVYRLCRSTPREFQLGQSVKIIHQHPDTTLMINHGLIPVGTVLPWAVRSDKLIRDLMARDTWRAAGSKEKAADYVLDVLEGYDLEKAEREEKATYDALDKVSGEAFRSLQFRNGSAVSVQGRRGPRRPPPLAKRDHKIVSSPRSSSDSSAGPQRSTADHNSVIVTER